MHKYGFELTKTHKWAGNICDNKRTQSIVTLCWLSAAVETHSFWALVGWSTSVGHVCPHALPSLRMVAQGCVQTLPDARHPYPPRCTPRVAQEPGMSSLCLHLFVKDPMCLHDHTLVWKATTIHV